jgi:hypothetical protein
MRLSHEWDEAGFRTCTDLPSTGVIRRRFSSDLRGALGQVRQSRQSTRKLARALLDERVEAQS